MRQGRVATRPVTLSRESGAINIPAPSPSPPTVASSTAATHLDLQTVLWLCLQ